MAEATKWKHVAKLIYREVGFFYSWSVRQETIDQACERAARRLSVISGVDGRGEHD